MQHVNDRATVHERCASDGTLANACSFNTATSAKRVFDTGDLHWTKRAVTVGANKGGTVQEACIPTDRVDDFIAGTLSVVAAFSMCAASNTVTPCAACRLDHSRQNKLLCDQD